METILGLIGSIFSGGLTGILGAAVQRYADYKNRQLDIALERERRETEIAKRKADAEIMAAEWAGREKVAVAEAAGREAEADAAAFAKSFELEPQRYATGELSWGQRWLMVLIDVLRGFVRPALTIYLCVLSTLIYFQTRELLNKEDLTSAEALELMRYVIYTILYLTVTVVCWWFGVRNKNTPPQRPGA